MSASLGVAVASLRQDVGDWEGNLGRVKQACAQARAAGASVLACAELALSGRDLADRWRRADTVLHAWQALAELLSESRDLCLIVGLPIHHEDRAYRVSAVLFGGQLLGLVPDRSSRPRDRGESRWEAAAVQTWRSPTGQDVLVGRLGFVLPGIGRVAVQSLDEVEADGFCGAEIVIDPTTSPFVLGGYAQRLARVRACAQSGAVVLCAGLHGNSGSPKLFDGASLIAQDGTLLACGDRFPMTREVTLAVAEVTLGSPTQAWRDGWQEIAVRGAFSPPKAVCSAPPSELDVDPSLAWVVQAGFFESPLRLDELAYVETELALCLGLSENRRQIRSKGFALALSGGRDSAMCAILVARMVAYAHPELVGEALKAEVRQSLITAYLPMSGSGGATQHAAGVLAAALGSEHVVIDLQEPQRALRERAERALGHALSWEVPHEDLTLQNLQARLRGVMIWTLANSRERVLLNTGNLSEAAVGYATMDGDTVGGLAPIGGVPKTRVSAWLSWARTRHHLEALDPVLAQAPSPELRPPEQSQTDERDLMPYIVLDTLLERFVHRGERPVEVLQHVWPTLHEVCGHDPQVLAAWIRKFVTMAVRAQWKRAREAMAFQVLDFSMDASDGVRFASLQDAFTEELCVMDAFVAEGRLNSSDA